jgi:hypothetical protein
MSVQENRAAIAVYQQQHFVPGEDYTTSPSALIDRTKAKLDTNYGTRVKRYEHDQQSLIFANALQSVNGTFEFTKEHREIGYTTIFEAMAAELHEVGANMKTRIKNGEEFENTYRQGCSSLNAKLMEEWNTCVIYAIPRNVDDKSIAIITIDPDLVVNDKHQTAKQVFAMREAKRTRGQMEASAKKLTRSSGSEVALNLLSSIIFDINAMVALPAGSRVAELTE